MSEIPQPMLDSLLDRIKKLEQKHDEYEALGVDAIREIKEEQTVISDISGVRHELPTSELTPLHKTLLQNNVIIPSLLKKARKIRRGKRGMGAKPLLESEIIEAQRHTKSANKAAIYLGVNYKTYKKYADKYGIFVKDTTGQAKREPRQPLSAHGGKYPISEILENKHPDFPIYRIKDKLIQSGLKKPECENCGMAERRLSDGKLPILLHFNDGNAKNHTLENMCILCYNCSFLGGAAALGIKSELRFDPDRLQGSLVDIKARF